MNHASLEVGVQYLKGVGPKRAKYYHKLGVQTIKDLLCLFPRRYDHYNHTKEIIACQIGELCCIRGIVLEKKPEKKIRKGLSLYQLLITDGTCNIKVTLFNSRYQYDLLKLHHEYYFRGKLQDHGNLLEMNSPLFIDPQTQPLIQPIYPLTEGLSNKMVCNHIQEALNLLRESIEDPLPLSIQTAEKLCHIRFAYKNIHFPQSTEALEFSRRRLVFDELLTLQMAIRLLKNSCEQITTIQIKSTDLSLFYASLPFTLTTAQQHTVSQILDDIATTVPMNRLIQGDVGCGKTIIACAISFCFARNGYQTALMAPTEMLAQQHLITFQSLLNSFGIRCCLLTGSLSPKKKESLKQAIQQGEYDIIIGTHALIEKTLQFHALGLVIADEQHRFGVMQRTSLAKKGDHPHCLIMSATPIPRTLAMIIYADLKVSLIQQLPIGRKPVETYFISSSKRQRAFEWIKQQALQGYQTYIVCPLISSDSSAETSVVSVEEYVKYLQQSTLSTLRIGILHGKMKADEKARTMMLFSNKHLDLLVCTTVIEVGMDIPNATIMLIENAEQFGLSQLHQLRGRVGRGRAKSYCILISDHQQSTTRNRLKTLTQSNDGFYIAEQDLIQRGPGDFFGSRQHGWPQLKIANLLEDVELLHTTHIWAATLFQQDPTLKKKEYQSFYKIVKDFIKYKFQMH